MYELGKRLARKFGGNFNQISPPRGRSLEGQSEEVSMEVWAWIFGKFPRGQRWIFWPMEVRFPCPILLVGSNKAPPAFILLARV